MDRLETITVDGLPLDPARFLLALYNTAGVQGLGNLHWKPGPWTLEEARAYVDEQYAAQSATTRRPGEVYFDYVQGRSIKVWFQSAENPEQTEQSRRLYERDNGYGSFNLAVLAAWSGLP
jgi:hypothetical protein